MKRIYTLLLLLIALDLCVQAQGIRERIRLKRDASAPISEAQGIDVTLTLSTVAIREVQQVVRTGGTIDNARKTLVASVPFPEASLVKVGQRARAIAPESKSSMFQARVSRVIPQAGKSLVEVMLSSTGLPDVDNYVLEITVELGAFLSVPNEAIIEEGTHRVVYVEEQKGRYVPHQIKGGVQGELYTAIESGLKAGDQVVTFGSFFIDSEYKLKLADQAAPQ